MKEEIKERLQEWVTTLIGLLLMFMVFYMVIEDKPILNTVIIFLLGVAMFFTRDTLVKKAVSLIGKIIK